MDKPQTKEKIAAVIDPAELLKHWLISFILLITRSITAPRLMFTCVPWGLNRRHSGIGNRINGEWRIVGILHSQLSMLN